MPDASLKKREEERKFNSESSHNRSVISILTLPTNRESNNNKKKWIHFKMETHVEVHKST